MIMWKTSSSAELSTVIARIEILKETDKFFVFKFCEQDGDFPKGEIRRAKGASFHNTFEEAKEHIVRRITRRIEVIKSDLAGAEAQLTKALETKK